MVEDLRNFNPKELYSLPDSAPRISIARKRLNTGRIKNLLTDMANKGATENELTRAIRYSMVVIDSVKHHLDVNQSYEDEGIAELEEKYGSVREKSKAFNERTNYILKGE